MLIFHKKSLKLASLYLAIIMSISLIFSFAIYQISSHELERGIRQPGPLLTGRGPAQALPFNTREELLKEREAQYEATIDRVLSGLLISNIIILVVSGFLSYVLAERTLRPIDEANQALERFTADASHELRTPITAMRAEIEVALMDPKISLPSARKVLQSNLEELTKLTILTEGLMKLARHKNGSLISGTVNVDEIIQTAIKRIGPIAKSREITLRSPKITGVKVWGDATSLSEAVFVLLDNAIKYSPNKTMVNISVTSDKKFVKIAIKDQGVGIKQADQAHIFERFWRADTARSKNEIEGYGIGLALAKHIVDLHNGKIEVHSKPSIGSTFTICLLLEG